MAYFIRPTITHTKDGKFICDVKGDDVYLAVDLVSGAYENLYDTAIIVSGDEDFVPAIQKAQKLGKKIINAFQINFFKLSKAHL